MSIRISILFLMNSTYNGYIIIKNNPRKENLHDPINRRANYTSHRKK